MNTKTLRSSMEPPNVGRRVVVLESTPLRRLSAALGDQGVRYALVENEDGLIGGIIDLRRVCKLLATENPMERARWEEVPVGSVKEVLVPYSSPTDVLDVLNAETGPEKWIGAFTAVRDEIGMAAVVIGGETFVNWDRVNATIMQNHFDAVTKIPGRWAFNRRIREEVDRAARAGQSLALLLIDLDNFKDVNDLYGHRAGDALLRVVAASLCDGVRSYDFVARFGGDEFAVLCAGCGPEHIHLPVARLCEAFERGLRSSSTLATQVTLSIGVAVMTCVDAGCCSETIVEQADTCLYRAKRGGRATTYVVELDPIAKPTCAPRELPLLDLQTC